MKILADENIEAMIIAQLRTAHHDVHAVVESHASVSDRTVMQLAIDEQRVLLTSDKDFGDLVFFYRIQPPSGIILLRLPENMDTAAKASLIITTLAGHEKEAQGSFIVISTVSVRISPLPKPPPSKQP
jgi:predicted nuclease of predicted toxin-antitoxin system